MANTSSSFCDELEIDEACLKIILNESATIYSQRFDCYMCDFEEWSVIELNTPIFHKFPSYVVWQFKARYSNNSECSLQNVIFGDRGVYGWNVSGENGQSIYNITPPNSEYLPFVIVSLVMIISLAAWKGLGLLKKTFHILEDDAVSNIQSDLGHVVSPIAVVPTIGHNVERIPMKSPRIKSIDVFRGITIALMIFVNYGGGRYQIFRHAAWNGVTVADMAFPWFAWIMGFSVALKTKSELRKRMPRPKVVANVTVRSLKLLALGMIVTNWGHGSFSKLRIPGVLQRLGLAYWLVACLETMLMAPQSSVPPHPWEEYRESWKQWAVVASCSIVHAFITFLLPVPGCGVGYVGPGGLHDHSAFENCTGGAAGYLDKVVFGARRIYQRPTCGEIYKCQEPYDPEGLLGTLTTILCVYMGVHAGRVLLIFPENKDRLYRWICWGSWSVLLSGILCEFSVEGGWIPLNKNLWSLSYVLFSGGVAFLLAALLYWVVDYKSFWSGHPFYQPGMNSILLFVGHEITGESLPWRWEPIYKDSHTELLLMDTWSATLWILISIWMYNNQLFVTI